MGSLMTQVFRKTESPYSGRAGFYLRRSCVISTLFLVWVKLWVGRLTCVLTHNNF